MARARAGATPGRNQTKRNYRNAAGSTLGNAGAKRNPVTLPKRPGTAHSQMKAISKKSHRLKGK